MTLLQVQHIQKEYDSKTILADASFHIAVGERVGLVGMNGGGKSTLLQILAGVETPDAGEIQWTVSSAMQRVAYLTQTPEWDPHSTILSQLEGVDLELLSRCGFPRNLWQRPAGELSGGEKTRAAIAKAVSQNPSLLLLDEPTNHLDLEGLQWLESFLATFAGSVLVVSHDRTFLDNVVARVLELHQGRIQAYLGNYSAYARQKSAERQRAKEQYESYVKEKRRLEEALLKRRQWAEKAHRDVPKYGADYYGAAAKQMMRGAKAIERRLSRLHAEKPETRLAMTVTC